MSMVQTNVSLPAESRALLERISERKDWNLAVVVRRGIEALANTDPELSDLRPVSVQVPVKSSSTDAAPVPVNTGTAA